MTDRPRRLAVATAGVSLFAIGFGLCLATGLRERDRVADAIGTASVAWLAAGLVGAIATMLVISSGWGRCLAALGRGRPVGQVLGWFFVGELGKYVPGAVWSILGRGELAHRGGIERPVAYRSVALSLFALYAATVVPLAIAAAHPRVQEAAIGVTRRVTGGRIDPRPLPWAALARLVLGYVPAWVLVAATTGAVVSAYGQEPGWQAPAAAIVAWVCGFLAVPVPAGAGVREAVFVAISGIEPGLALTVAVTARLLYLIADLGAAAIAAPGVGGVRRAAIAR